MIKMLATVTVFKIGKAEMSAANQNFSFDPDKLRAKYRRERDKRIRADGMISTSRSLATSRTTLMTRMLSLASNVTQFRHRLECS